jgi:hypothetical protein
MPDVDKDKNSRSLKMAMAEAARAIDDQKLKLGDDSGGSTPHGSNLRSAPQ